MKRAIVIALTLAAAFAGTTGSAFADSGGNNGNGGGNGDNHNVCVVFSPDQKYNNTTYYCISTPTLPPL